ncbi:hypothetical protein [Streptomyces violaceusniger]|uniref:hypothetical protein n=1 Tax=Streptomyces violaceusniger TaxID=68280 RepID=UPI0031D4CD1D
MDQLQPPAPITLHTTLPRDVADFTGRTDELARLSRAAEEGQAPVVTIHTVDGMPGVGKTALVIHTAHLLASDYPDGHRFVRLGTHTPTPRPARRSKPGLSCPYAATPHQHSCRAWPRRWQAHPGSHVRAAASADSTPAGSTGYRAQ